VAGAALAEAAREFEVEAGSLEVSHDGNQDEINRVSTDSQSS